ncbi:hypothetical protein [Pajaroellobacter abortibovis]|uniref:Uncharacterized protein n=1 Tax=Pajaroellobacter abortibovis TaxID=1882918 RepID=A0A1L6MWZ1_9BACT|nr:hypothetical protein [Pajaroellobacter abortibovis]APS00057.1 hypothetical protein BCY86_04705 [Pajaroellobacter abortibovis]
MSVLIDLQYGVLLETYVHQFTFTRFELQGVEEDHPHIKFATSVVDYLFHILRIEYLCRYDLVYIQPEGYIARII